MKNVELIKYKKNEDTLIIIFEGEFFDQAIPSIIIEKQLYAIRKYAEENGLKSEEVLIKIRDGSLIFELAAGATLILALITMLNTDYTVLKNRMKNFPIPNFAQEVIKKLFEPIKRNKDSKVTFKDGKGEEKSFNSDEAEKILSCLPNEQSGERMTLRGYVYGIKTDSKFSLKSLKQSKEINLFFVNKKFNNIEDIRQQFAQYVEVEGVVNINKKGVITSMKVAGYKTLPDPQSGLFENI